MKLTVIHVAVEGLVDHDYPPLVYEGHLDKAKCTQLARRYGAAYPTLGFTECDPKHENPVYYCNYSNMENPPRNPDGTVERPSQGDIELWFYHTEPISPESLPAMNEQ